MIVFAFSDFVFLCVFFALKSSSDLLFQESFRIVDIVQTWIYFNLHKLVFLLLFHLVNVYDFIFCFIFDRMQI